MSRAHSFGRLTAGALAALVAGAGLHGVAMAQAPAPTLTQTPVSAPAPAQPQGPLRDPLSGGVAVIVNDDVISTYDLRQRALLLIITSGVPATQENLPQIQQEALRSLVDEHIQLQELQRLEKEQKFDVVAKDDEVDEALAQLAKENNSSIAQLKAQFSSVGLDIETLRNQLRVQISWNRMIGGRYGTRVRVGDKQISAMLERLKTSSNEPRYQVSEIFIDAARAGGMNEAMTGAQQLITQIQQGAPFAPVARQFSAAPTAANGGDLGWVNSAELSPELSAVVSQMRPGQISQPIQVSDGVYILQLRDKEAGGATTTVDLKQAAVRLESDATPDQVSAAQKTLATFSATQPDCASLEAKAATVPGVVAGDLGKSDVKDLSQDFRTPAEGLPLNQLSQPIRTPVGLHLLMVCDRQQTNTKLPTKDEIENRLYGQQLSMLSRRYLRDLRNSATIETP
jgi:peptidyl-prolyl cis-trans isomerase SurA